MRDIESVLRAELERTERCLSELKDLIYVTDPPVDGGAMLEAVLAEELLEGVILGLKRAIQLVEGLGCRKDPIVIDLGDYPWWPVVTPTFIGFSRGASVRERSGLDLLVEAREPFEVHVPLDTIAVTSSFFEGMFGDAIRVLGDDFRNLIRFTGRDIEHVIEFCLGGGRKIL